MLGMARFDWVSLWIPQIWDIVIVGGGVAGAALANTLGKVVVGFNLRLVAQQ